MTFSLWIYTYKFTYIDENNFHFPSLSESFPFDSPFPINIKLCSPEHQFSLWLHPNASLSLLQPLPPAPQSSCSTSSRRDLGFPYPHPTASFSHTCDSPEPSSSKKYLTMVPSAWPDRIPFPEQLKKGKRRKQIILSHQEIPLLCHTLPYLGSLPPVLPIFHITVSQSRHRHRFLLHFQALGILLFLTHFVVSDTT